MHLDFVKNAKKSIHTPQKIEKKVFDISIAIGYFMGFLQFLQKK